MAELVTLENIGSRIWFGSSSAKQTSNSDGGSNTDSSDKNGAPKPVPVGKFYVSGNKLSRFEQSGNPFDSTGFKVGTNQNISDHMWQTSVWGVGWYGGETPSTVSYSPILDSIVNGVSFDWEKRDDADKADSQHIRCAAMGLIYRGSTTNNYSYLRGFDCPTNYELHKYSVATTATTVSGSTTKSFSPVSQVVGFYVCCEHQGNSIKYTNSKIWVKIKNLRFKTNKSGSLMMWNKGVYSTYPRNLTKLWTP